MKSLLPTIALAYAVLTAGHLYGQAQTGNTPPAIQGDSSNILELGNWFFASLTRILILKTYLAVGLRRVTPMVNWYLSDYVRLEWAYDCGHLDGFGLNGNTILLNPHSASILNGEDFVVCIAREGVVRCERRQFAMLSEL